MAERINTLLLKTPDLMARNCTTKDGREKLKSYADELRTKAAEDNEQQRNTIDRLKAEGFTIEGHGKLVVAVKGNDRRVIYPDGEQRRALGAKR